VHNGEIHGIERIRRELLFAVDSELFPHIYGTTDSEVMFFLMLTFGLDEDPIGAAERMAGFVEAAAKRTGISDALWMTLGYSDGETLYAVRYATDGDAPTLFHSREMDDLYEFNPALRRVFARHSRAVVSEPLGNLAAAWSEIPQATALIVRPSGVESRPFVPKAP
jgi:glutamine amidotransferase